MKTHADTVHKTHGSPVRTFRSSFAESKRVHRAARRAESGGKSVARARRAVIKQHYWRKMRPEQA